MNRAEERRLLGLARAGDARALSRLLETVAAPAYRFGRGFCGDPHDAEDVMQDVLASLVRGLDRFRGEASLTTWAYVVARNACFRHRRRAGARTEPLDANGLESGPDLVDSRADPAREMERGELRAALAQAIAALPPPQREVLVLRDVEGLPAAEVGQVLRLGERAVKSRLHRARTALREKLAPHVEGRAQRSDRRARCPDTVRLASRYLEGELDAAACSRLSAHVELCADCGVTCKTLRSALAACRGWGADPLPAEIRTQVRDAIRRLVAGRRGGSGRLRVDA